MNLRSAGIAAILSLTLIFSACGEQLEEPTSQERETYIGTFKSLGSISVNKTITHLFETEDGEILYAYSDRYDLDSDKYFDTLVEAYGLVLEYESLDKPAFEVQRVTEAPEDELEDEDVEMVDYKDTELGFTITYPNNWEFSALRDSIQLQAPAPEPEDEETAEELAADYIIIATSDTTIGTDPEITDEQKAEEIHTFVSANYPELSSERGLISSIGVDGQFAVSYKPESGNIHYFAPRGNDLYEISFYHPEEDDYDRVKNSNVFFSLVSSFRFLPIDGEEVEEPTEDTEEIEEPEVEDPIEEEPEPEPVVEPSADQVTFSSYRELDSAPYGFTISYPGNWYYSGAVNAYSFADESFADEEVEAIIQLSINSGKSAGISQSGSSVSVTVVFDGKSYTLTGPAEYEAVMEVMANSIKALETTE